MNLSDLIPRTLIRKAGEYTRKLWVRVVILGLMAFVAVGITQILEPLVPDKLARTLNGTAADRLLDIIANAMLAATIFSITVMVTVYRSSSTQFTPRVHRLIIEDRTTQNTLAVFVGAYLYAMLGIILRELGVYADDRAFVLFVMTVAVLGVILIYLIRWVLHLQTFGSLIDTTRQIEDVTRKQFRERLKNPCLGAHPLIGDVPDDAVPVPAIESGYVQHIYPEALNDVAKRFGIEVYLTRNIGCFVFLNETMLQFTRRGEPDEDAKEEDLEKALRAAIRVGDVRTYDQDPRFGLTVMGEVASKALSPGINDPGTAIDVITRIGRILSDYADETKVDHDDLLAHIYVAPLDPVDLINDGFFALARDGVAVVEVQQRLQAVLSGLMRHPDDGLSKAARNAAEEHLRRALDTISFAADRKRLLGSARSDVRDAALAQIKGDDGDNHLT